MKKLKRSNKKGILFFITGLAGSGKTAIAKKIKKKIIRLYGPTLLINGDDVRKISSFHKYTYEDRLSLSKKFCKFAKFVTNQKINVIFASVGMMHKTRKWYKNSVDNYIEIYIKTDLNKIIKLKRKKLYHNKKSGDVVGITIKPEFPKQPDIIIDNDFKKSTNTLSNNLIKKISKIV